MSMLPYNEDLDDALSKKNLLAAENGGVGGDAGLKGGAPDPDKWNPIEFVSEIGTNLVAGAKQAIAAVAAATNPSHNPKPGPAGGKLAKIAIVAPVQAPGLANTTYNQVNTYMRREYLNTLHSTFNGTNRAEAIQAARNRAAQIGLSYWQAAGSSGNRSWYMQNVYTTLRGMGINTTNVTAGFNRHNIPPVAGQRPPGPGATDEYIVSSDPQPKPNLGSVYGGAFNPLTK